MLSEKLNHTYRDLISIFIFLDTLFVSFIVLWFFGFDGNVWLGLVIALGGTLGLWILTIVRFKSYKHELKKRRYSIIELQYKLNYPHSFIKKIPYPSLGLGLIYRASRKRIPKKFIGFEEGHRAYVIKEIDHIHRINLYRVILMHPRYGALIEDVNHQKYVIDIRNLAVIS